MIKYLIILLMSLCIYTNVYSDSFIEKDYITYYGTTDNTITLQWEESIGAVKYEMKYLYVEHNTYSDIVETNNTQLTITLPRTGHYIFEIRAIDSSDMISEWASSIINEDTQTGSFWVYGYLAPPGDIIIN